MLKPTGFADVTPYFFVAGAADFIVFLNEAFGAAEVGRSEMPDGTIANAQMQIASAMVMVSEAGRGFEPTQGAYYLYVENADYSMDRAVRAGAEKIMDVMDMDYGDRQGGVRDPFGNIWWVSQRLVDADYH